MDMKSSTATSHLTRKALIFIIVTAFLSTMGFGLINPVAPFIVARYVGSADNTGVVLGWLLSAYAICQFIAAPGLGILSDRFGRRPILMICMLGSAVGYLLFGIGGALWVLFLGRIIDGITGANFSVSFAYIADLTPPEERGKFFGWVGAIAGIGSIIGPAIGGLLAKIDLTAPLYFAAAITFANLLFGLLFMPESLDKAHRDTEPFQLAKLNPLSVLRQVLAVPQLRWLLIAIFLYYLPFAALVGNIGLYAKDSLNWDAATIGSLFGLVGISDIVVQGLFLPRLLKRFGDGRVAIGGLIAEIVGYALIASVVIFPSALLMYAGVLILAAGDGLLGPSLSGLLSRAAGNRSQGQVQGGSQSVQALARIIGPLGGGELYDRVGHAAPYLSGFCLVFVTITALGIALPRVHQNAPVEEAPAVAG
jgi:DHA1 family tetracycline resistance protein-like MFS transporter